MFLGAMLVALLSQTSTLMAQTKPAAKSDRLEVVYFHSEHRCKTCLQIEKMTKEVLKQQYGKEVKNGNIVFKIYNVDDAKNAGVAEKFEATGSALYLNRVKSGKGKITDLTDFGFTNAFNEAVFSEKLMAYINTNLK